MPGPQRTAIPNSERQALRARRRAVLTATSRVPTHKQLMAWFQETFGHPINQSVVSRSLSDVYDFLDVDSGDEEAHVPPSALRKRDSQWPTLELALIEWYREERARGTEITNADIAAEASRLWDCLEVYQGQEVRPKFSDGWLNAFKRRFRVDVAKVERKKADVEPPVPHEAALEALSLVIKYEQQQKETDKIALQTFIIMKQRVLHRQQNDIRRGVASTHP